MHTVGPAPGGPSILAAFGAHLAAGLTTAGLGATAALASGLTTPPQTLACLALGTAGSLLPDLDADSSAPVKVSFNLAAAALAFLALFLAAPRFPSVAELLVVWVGVFLAGRWLLFGALARATVHRGMLHSLPAAAFFGVVTTAGAHRGLGVEAPVAWAAGSFVAAGYLVHLVLDEVYAVNLFGARTRRSLGSALKLWSRRGAGATLALYLATALALALSPSPGSFARALADPALAARIERHLWPADGWFSGK